MGILGNKSSVRQRSARTSPLRRRRMEYRIRVVHGSISSTPTQTNQLPGELVDPHDPTNDRLCVKKIHNNWLRNDRALVL